MTQPITSASGIEKLVEHFGMHRDVYVTGRYNETQLRREFIDPMWKALGWDIDNERGYAEAYKDVIHEDAIKVSADSFTKAPDYCFRIGGVRKFFLEAKKPAVNIKRDPAPAFQLRRYAWSAKLPLSVLTDFEELAVYDTSVKPASTDRSSKARILLFSYTEYVRRWDEIAAIFSRDAVLKGSFDKYAATTKGKRGTAQVDAAFLQDIESWRDVLARNLALRNGSLSQREINFAVQSTIDRIVFLRISEDRGIEPYGELLGVTNGTNTYHRMFELFERADKRYNSGLFHFSREKGRSGVADGLTTGLEIDDKPLKDIIKSLYYPDSPYEFSVLGADILGQVYEQFLGKVIRLTAGHRAVVEEKPEVKKAGGVYYTPAYIVDYIVRETVGKLLEEKTPKDVAGRGRRRAAPLRVLDPACGSGSFLVGAYQHLLDWHRDWYVADGPRKHAAGKIPVLYQAAGGDWRLTTAERKRILLTNIFGVDIDEQAVEVTKLSLLLKVLEGESDQTLQAELRLFHERALPDLDGNIKSGNSLIGPEFYAQQEMAFFDDAVRHRVNVFDWRTEFPQVFGRKDGGFDAVIGNPPYIRIQALNEWYPEEAAYYKRMYVAGSKGNFDIYVLFVERGLELLSGRGRLGMILPSKFLSTDYGSGIRGVIATNGALSQVVDFAHAQVFTGATTYTCLLFLAKQPAAKVRYIKVIPSELSSRRAAIKEIEPDSLTATPWLFEGVEASAMLRRMATSSVTLLDVPAAMSRGSSTGADHVFCLTFDNGALHSREGEEVEIEDELLRQPIYASDFGRYRVAVRNGERLLFPYRLEAGGYSLLDESELRAAYPKAYDYLRSRKATLEKRKQFSRWYSFSAPRNLHVHQRAHVLVPLLADKASYAPAPSGPERYCLMASGGFSITVHETTPAVNPLFVLGVLNSRLLFWNLRIISNKFRGGWITCTKQYVGALPIRLRDSSQLSFSTGHQRIVDLVRINLELYGQIDSAVLPYDQARIQRDIKEVNTGIDRLVYALYDLSDAEVEIVEQATA